MPAPASSRHAQSHDLELCAQAVAGDRAAFGELARRHGSAVRGLLRRMGAGDALADDLAQDAFLAAFERIAEFRAEGTFAGWVKRIAARLYLRRLQRERRLAKLTELDGPPESAATDAGADARLDLDESLKILAPAERLCLSLCFGADMSHAEAAEALNLPLGTVKSHVRRGLDKLRARLTPPLEGSRGNG